MPIPSSDRILPCCLAIPCSVSVHLRSAADIVRNQVNILNCLIADNCLNITCCQYGGLPRIGLKNRYASSFINKVLILSGFLNAAAVYNSPPSSVPKDFRRALKIEFYICCHSDTNCATNRYSIFEANCPPCSIIRR